jgi:MFS family permease
MNTQPDTKNQFRVMIAVALSSLLGMSVWFSASAVVPLLRDEWHLSENAASWLTLSVQLGFVAGTLTSALLNLSDVFNARRLFAACAAGAALANAAFALQTAPAAGMLLRFITGFALAGVYPPAMKIMASWFRTGRGAAIGVLIAALTLGKAFPYLVNAFGMENWRHNMLAVSAFALAAGFIMLFLVGDGPFAAPAAKFDASQVGKVFGNRAVRLASYGYFGHMWELYAMWTWLPVFIRASLSARNAAPHVAEAISFVGIGAGAVGCVAAGLLADRFGRTLITSAALLISGLCCLAIGLLFGAHPAWLVVAALIWGASVVADSAQFSTCVTELADPLYTGTALTLQTCIGFLITLVSIRLVPLLLPQLFGIVSMLRLRGLPEALLIAGGKK